MFLADLRAVVRMAILASGNGSNAQRLMEHFKQHPGVCIALVGCDQPTAGVIQRAWDHGVSSYLFNSNQLKNGTVQYELQQQRIDLVVLAGFLRLIPPELVKAYAGRIINIHPSLLPKYGGKGMYGLRVHEAVIAARETQSGITIHYVNERFDEGGHIAQFNCPVLTGDTAATLAERVHKLEHEHFPLVIEQLVTRLADGKPLR